MVFINLYGELYVVSLNVSLGVSCYCEVECLLVGVVYVNGEGESKVVKSGVGWYELIKCDTVYEFSFGSLRRT